MMKIGQATPHLHTSMQIDLRDLHVHYRDYDLSDNPPLLRQKDLLVAPDYTATKSLPS